jgi:hypothetical protein
LQNLSYRCDNVAVLHLYESNSFPWFTFHWCMSSFSPATFVSRRVYPKVSGLASWSENCKWYSTLPLGAVVSLFCESVWWVLPPQPFVLLLNECLLLCVLSAIRDCRL